MHFVYKNHIGLRSAVRLAVVSSLINIIFHTENLLALMHPLDLPNHFPTVLHHSPRHPSFHKNHLTCFSLDDIVDTATKPSVPGNSAASRPASTLLLCHFWFHKHSSPLHNTSSLHKPILYFFLIFCLIWFALLADPMSALTHVRDAPLVDPKHSRDFPQCRPPQALRGVL